MNGALIVRVEKTVLSVGGHQPDHARPASRPGRGRQTTTHRRAESTGMTLPHPAWTTAAASDKSVATAHATTACRRPNACHSRSSGAAGDFEGRIVAIAEAAT